MKESWDEWDEMCQYVKKEIMGYDENMKIPKYIILRLRGLQKGQFLANNNIKPMASYSSKIILLTFKFKKMDITKSIQRKQADFKDEKHKFNYIMSIIESSINDVYLKCKQKEEQKRRIENVDINIDNATNSDIEKVKQETIYQNVDKKINKRLEKLW